MLFLIGTSALLLLIGYSSALPPTVPTVENCGKSVVERPRVVGGETEPFGSSPWMVSIQQKNSKGTFDHICGGSIIHESWIVTAAHCFNTSIILTSNYKAYVGVRSILHMSEDTVQKHNLSQITRHEDYDDKTFANDIALLKTASPIKIKESKGYVNAICLPTGFTDPTGDAIVTGWGHTSSGGKMINLLQWATVPMVKWQTCKNIYGDKKSEFEKVLITPAMICAGGQGKDTCQGDSGGPLIQVTNGVATLIGTVANGAECAYKHYPGVYMKVSAFTNWMGRKMK